MKYQIMQSFLYARPEFAELDQEIKAEFATLRVHAEKLYTQIHGETAVIPLSEIYRELLRFRAADEKFTELLAALEEEADQIMQVLPKVDEDLLRPLEREIYKRGDLFSGLSVMASQSMQTDGESTAYMMGGMLGGPLFFPYVKWVIDKSMKLGIKRLYFVARDGYVLKRIADQIIAGEEIETKYIYGSRQAWQLPVTKEEYAVYIRRTCVTAIENLYDMAQIMDIPVEWLEEALPLKYKEKRGYTEEEKADVQMILLNNRQYMDKVLKRFSEKRCRAVSYLKQNIDVSDSRYAFVELGGTGYTMECMAGLMGDLQNPFYAFYYRMDAFSIHSKRVRFLNYSMLETGHEDIAEALLEVLCRAPHGRCIGYQELDGKAFPELNDEGEDVIRYGLEEFCDGLDCYVKKLLVLMNLVPTALPSVRFVHRILLYLINTPDQDVLQYLGDMPFDWTGKWKDTIFAPRLSEADLWNYYYEYEMPKYYWYRGASLKYSLLRCTEEERQLGESFRRQKDATIEEERCKRKKEIERQRAHTRYDFPVLPAGSRVIVYGAGKVGQEYVKYIANTLKYELVTWVDRNSEKYGFEVESIESGLKKDFDYLVIAIAAENIVQEIKTYLTGLGIEAECIVWRDPKENDVYMY